MKKVLIKTLIFLFALTSIVSACEYKKYGDSDSWYCVKHPVEIMWEECIEKYSFDMCRKELITYMEKYSQETNEIVTFISIGE